MAVPLSARRGSPGGTDYRMAEGIRWDDFDEALAAVRDIDPGGHYLGHPHTLANFERAFFMPQLLDNSAFEQWVADGAKDTTAPGRWNAPARC